MAKQMCWSMFKDLDGEYDQWEENDVAFYFNMDINASPHNRVKFFRDGIHEVFYGRFSTFIEVKNGKFDIEAVKPLIADIVEKAGYWGEYIEGFCKRDGKFHVEIGS